MKRPIVILAASVLAALMIASSDARAAGCTANGIYLAGKVRYVSSGADVKVKVVAQFEDLRVKKVTGFADSCGEWQVVTRGEDFTIQTVERFEDVKIKYVSRNPGAR